MIYFTSDWHLNHQNILKLAKRPFKDVIHMQREFIYNIIKTISSKSDKLFMLGDMSFGNKDNLLSFIESIKAPIFVIPGNHDKNNICNFLRRRGVNVLPRGTFTFEYKELIVSLSHRPIERDLLRKNEINIHGHKHYKRKGVMKSSHYYDCGVDNNNFAPIGLNEVLMKRRNLLR